MYVVDDAVAVGELIAVLENSISRATELGAFDGPRALEIASAKLTLSIAATRARGGGINFRVPVLGTEINVGAKQERRLTHTLELTLNPAWGKIHELRDGEIEDTLVGAICAIYTLMGSAGAGDRPWTLSSGVIDLVFAVSESGTITLGVEGDRTGEATHSLQLSVQPARTGDSEPTTLSPAE